MALGYWASYLCWSAYTGCLVLKNVITRIDMFFRHLINHDDRSHGFLLSNLDSFMQLIF